MRIATPVNRSLVRNDREFCKGCGAKQAGDREGRPYGGATRSAMGRDDVGIVPYGSITRGAMGGRPQGSPLRMRYKGCGTERNPPVTASPCQPPLGRGARGTGDADCHSQCAHWLRNDRGFYKGCGGESTGGQRRPPLRRRNKECGGAGRRGRRPLRVGCK